MPTKTTEKPLLLLYGDGAMRVANVVLRHGAQVYEEAVYDPDQNPPSERSVFQTVRRRTFVLRTETKRYLIYEEVGP